MQLLLNHRLTCQVLSTLLWLSIGRGSLKGVLSTVETLLSWQQQETLSTNTWTAIRSLKSYRQHLDLPSPTDLSFLGVWRYHSVAPQSKKRGYVSSSAATCATDGSYLYIINKEGLLKIGTGFGGTVPSFVRCLAQPALIALMPFSFRFMGT